jgi:NAD(P)-dependent dehydrogenase (short-subunit alcohol dehydrogenase family)
VAIVTGAGRGLGREHARLLAAEGAIVVVNDCGVEVDGSGEDASLAERVAQEIVASGGKAVADASDVADWKAAEALVRGTVERFGDLHVLVNNAGILRDRMLVNMSEEEWDSVVRVHLKGHAAPTRHAAAYWRERSKAGAEVSAAVVNTTSTSGLLGNPGQTNYGSAKAAIAAFTVIAAQELGRYGVRVNAVAPAARTRMTESTPGLSEVVRAGEAHGGFDVWDPANVSPVVAYLASPACPFTGKVLFVQGGRIRVMQPWSMGAEIDKPGRWSIEELAETLPRLVG